MKYRILLLAVLSTLPSLLVWSQDMCTQDQGPAILDIYSTTREADVYKEPRWVSWPGTAIGFNMLGLAQAGPTVQVDIRLYKGLYLVPSLRYNYLGYASHHLFTFFDSDSEYSPASFSGGMGARYFFALPKKNNLVFTGLFGEYSHDQASYNLGSSWESERTRNAVNIMANIGYRWWFRRDFFLHLSVYGGVSFELVDESLYLLGAYKGDLERDYMNTPFVGVIDLTFGWNL